MAIIPGVTVNWRLSPRVITIPNTVTSVTVESLQDTLLDLESQETDGMLFPHLRNTSGGENLGGGVSVGWTMELQNSVVAFAPRTVSSSTGTATTLNTAGTTLIDSASTFITDGVTAGATIINFTDKSVASVISVDSEIQLTHYVLGDGTDNQWGVGDSYKIWNEVQTEIAGGNTVAVDGVGSAISPIRATFGTQVLKTSSSSATTQEQLDIQFSSFNGGVTIDETSSNIGTTFPTGTPRQPVNNLSDALLIANTRGFTTFFIIGNITIPTVGVFDSKEFVGESQTKTLITIPAGASVLKCEFTDAEITGTLDGESKIKGCKLGTISFVNGVIEQCIFQTNTVTLGGTSVALFLDCWSGVQGTATPIIDMGGGGRELGLRNYNGGMKLINKTGADAVSIDLNSGQIIVDSTVIAGSIIIRGIGNVTDNSGVGANVDTSGLLTKGSIADQVWDELISEHTISGSVGKKIKDIDNFSKLNFLK